MAPKSSSTCSTLVALAIMPSARAISTCRVVSRQIFFAFVHAVPSPARPRHFAVCVDNDGYEASLERDKIYVVRPDKDAEKAGDLRVVDESGEDYLFSAERFVAIDVPAAVEASILKAS
jgi:hypothetical protein